jgi:hypothetical protein
MIGFPPVFTLSDRRGPREGTLVPGEVDLPGRCPDTLRRAGGMT